MSICEGTAPLPMGCIADEIARENTASAVGVRLGAELAINDDISEAEPASIPALLNI